MIATILFVAGLILAIWCVLDILKQPISLVGKVIVAVVVLATNWLGLLLYYFWAKSEWEIIISAWIRADVTKPIKIDVFDQVMMNWEQFCKYTWDHGLS